MKDPKLEEQISTLSTFMSSLKNLSDVISSTLRSEVVMPENERRLNYLRENLPVLSRKFYDEVSLPQDYAVDKLLEQVVDLGVVIKLTDLEKRKFFDSWHKIYMDLYFLMGKLEYRKEKVERLNLFKLRAKKLVKNPIFILICLGIIALIIFSII